MGPLAVFLLCCQLYLIDSDDDDNGNDEGLKSIYPNLLMPHFASPTYMYCICMF